MKILIVAHRWLPRLGGLQNISYKYAELLSKNNQVSIITSKEKEFINIKPIGTKLIEVKANPFLYNNFSIPQPIFNPYELYIKMKKAVKNNEIIIINDRYYLTSIFATFFAKKYNKKIILMLHTSIQNYSGIKKIFYYINNLIGKYVVINSTHIVGISKNTLEEVLKFYDYQPLKKEVINNIQSKSGKFRFRKNKNLKVLFVGRIIKDKGIDSIIRLAKKLKHNKINFIIIGEGNEEEFLKNEIKKQRLENIKFIGPIYNRLKLIKYYQNTDVFILLSKKKEGLSLTTCDALLQGKPIFISSKVPFLDIEKKGGGYIVDPRNLDKISNKLKLLQKDFKLYNKMAKNAYNYGKKYLNMDKNLKKFKKILKC